MQYRKFGKLSWKPSALGFGCMRLPILDNDFGKVNEPLAIQMIRYAIDNGVNYVDTAYFYHRGQSEFVVGQALRDGYHERIKLATKLPASIIQSARDFDRIFNEQLARLETDYIDFYLLHSLTRETWPKIRDLGVIPWAENLLKTGRINYLGFSFHDEYPVFQEIIDAYDKWTFCQIQYNFADTNCQAGTRGLKYAADKGLGVIIMEPLRGGAFTRKPPEKVAQLWARAPKKRSPAEWGLFWVWNHPEVSFALSGMSAMEQVKENIALASRSGINILSPDELELIEEVGKAYNDSNPIPCTNCRYCMPCPNGVDIPQNFSMYNEVAVFDSIRSRLMYRGMEKSKRSESCIECGQCVEKCPQKINIPEELKKIHAFFTSIGIS